MANISAPTHIFGGGVALKGNTFPSTLAADDTFGGFAPTFEILDGSVAARTIASTDGLVFLITPTVAVALDLPAAGADMNGRIYTFYCKAGGAGDTVTFTAGGGAISGGTVVAATTVATVTIVYSAGAVASQIITSA